MENYRHAIEQVIATQDKQFQSDVDLNGKKIKTKEEAEKVDPWRRGWAEIEKTFYNTSTGNNADGSGQLTSGVTDFSDAGGKHSYTSLARLFSIYVLPQLKHKQAWDDIQLIFYPANESSYGYSQFDSLACIPVHRERWLNKWNTFRAVIPNPSLLQFISMTLKFVENDRAGGGYGLGQAFTSKYNDKTKTYETTKATACLLYTSDAADE